MPHFYYRCQDCGATLSAPTKDMLVPLLLTHERDHHGVMDIKREQLLQMQKSFKSYEPEGPRKVPTVPLP